MAVKFVIETLEEVPEHLRGEYEEQDGRYRLKTDGEMPEVIDLRKKVNEFRTHNVRVLKEKDELVAKLKNYDGVDPKELEQLKQRVSEFERSTGASDPKALPAIIQQQVAAAIAPYEQKERERTEREQRMAQQLARKNVESSLRDAATKAGVEDAALPDFLHRGLDVFTYDEDRVVAREADGSPVFSKQSPGKELTPEEWAFGLAETAPHLFRESNGGGAPGGSGGGGAERGGQKWVDGSNPIEVGRNLEDIAAGRVRVANRS